MFNTNKNLSLITSGFLKFPYKKSIVNLKKYAFIDKNKKVEFFIDTYCARKQGIILNFIEHTDIFKHYKSTGPYFDLDKQFIKLEFFVHYLISQKKKDDFLIKSVVTKIAKNIKNLNEKFPNFIEANCLTINKLGILNFKQAAVEGKLKAADNFFRSEKNRKLDELRYSNSYDIVKNTHTPNIDFPLNPSILINNYWAAPLFIYSYNEIEINYIKLSNLFLIDDIKKSTYRFYNHLNTKDFLLAYNVNNITTLRKNNMLILNDQYIELNLALHLLFRRKQFFHRQVGLLRIFHNLLVLDEC